MINLRKRYHIAFLLLLIPAALQAQQLPVKILSDPARRAVTITADGKPFTTFLYPDTLEKPVLYPIYAPDGQLITRGFPRVPRPGEPVDHPHHIGLWFNYENVNGLDFWNNSYAIPAAKKSQYGWIRTDSVKTDNDRSLTFYARWTNQADTTLLTEHTTYVFYATKNERIIDRFTVLTAMIDVSFPDAKDGLLGLRVTKELQIPSNTPGEFVDDKGNITKVAAGNTPDINGNYLTSEGKTGDSAWATRGKWCMLYGKKQNDTLSVAIIDYPQNPGYPTYWHARGYGLFAANPLGQKIFSKGAQMLNFHLDKGQSATFHYRVVIAAGDHRLSTDRITALADEPAKP
jgi:Methane oxygenase PmoA